VGDRVRKRPGVAADLVSTAFADVAQLRAKVVGEFGDGVGDLAFDLLDLVEVLPGGISQMG
jgi:hypothetical protein